MVLGIDTRNANRLIEVLSLAYVTSFIFYLIVVRLKENETQQVILPFIADHTYVLMNNLLFFLFSMRDAAGLKYEKFDTSIYNRDFKLFLSDDELKKACEDINPNELTDENLGTNRFTVIPHFYGKMIHYALRMDYFLDMLLSRSFFMDPELIKILTDIKASGYHYRMTSYSRDSVLTATHRHNHLRVFNQSFRHYFNIFKQLEEYSDKHLKKHVERKSLKTKKEE